MKKPANKSIQPVARYQSLRGDVSRIIESANGLAARSRSAVTTVACWLSDCRSSSSSRVARSALTVVLRSLSSFPLTSRPDAAIFRIEMSGR